MPAIICYIAELKVPPNVTLEDVFTIQGRTIGDCFQQASALTSGGAAINLSMDVSQRHLLTPPTTAGVCDSMLQTSLSQIFKAATLAAPLRVGLILADIYLKYPDAYGCMFDLDQNTPDYCPRQGCALFVEPLLGAIQNINGSTRDFQDFLTFTAIHELGHAFNLWHLDTSSFMVPAPDASSFKQTLSFVDDENNYLRYGADTDDAPYVLPGKSAFNDRGPLVPAIESGSLMRPPSDSAVKLEIRMSQEEFFHFEPVELDVRVICARKGIVKIPDRIDPSHESFALWITRPDGERFRYRPGKIVCAAPRFRKISQTKPFSRDISFFRHCGGPTFSIPGRHQVQAVMTLSKKTSIFSNVVSCEVIPPKPRFKMYADMKKAFSSIETIRFLRYKTQLPPAPALETLKRFANRNSSAASAATIHYSLGRTLLALAERQTDASLSQRLRIEVLSHLQKATAIRS